MALVLWIYLLNDVGGEERVVIGDVIKIKDKV